MQISAINSLSNKNRKQLQNTTNASNYITTNNTAFKGKEKSVGFVSFIKKLLSKFVKLISKPKLTPEELLKTYTKEEDLGKAIRTAFKIKGGVKKDQFSPELQKFIAEKEIAQKQEYGNQKVFWGVKSGKEQYSYCIEEDGLKIHKIISSHFL